MWGMISSGHWLLPDHLALVVVVELARRMEAELAGNCFRGGVIRVDVGGQPGHSLDRHPVTHRLGCLGRIAETLPGPTHHSRQIGRIPSHRGLHIAK